MPMPVLPASPLLHMSTGPSTVNYDDFISDASVGDMLLVDGGIMSMEVKAITDTGGRVDIGGWAGG